ncbi:hypothetical protein BSK58_24870 [Paenibacillus odorifer]|nr:hypothetical protein BSK58_24870 [Paenibacillus odorifer]
MNVIGCIIKNRSKLMEFTHGVTSLKLFGSVLDRTEQPESNIDFIAVFDMSKYEWTVHTYM